MFFKVSQNDLSTVADADNQPSNNILSDTEVHMGYWTTALLQCRKEAWWKKTLQLWQPASRLYYIKPINLSTVHDILLPTVSTHHFNVPRTYMKINTEYTIPKAATAASKPSFSSSAVMTGSPEANWFPAVVLRAAAKIIDKHCHSSEHNKLL